MCPLAISAANSAGVFALNGKSAAAGGKMTHFQKLLEQIKNFQKIYFFLAVFTIVKYSLHS